MTRSASRSSNRSTDDETESGDERGSDRRGEGRLNEAREVQRMETILEEGRANEEEEEKTGKTAEDWKDSIEKAEFSEVRFKKGLLMDRIDLLRSDSEK